MTTAPTTLWGSGNGEDSDATFWLLNRSLPVDLRLLREELTASLAYVRALGRAAVLPGEQTARLEAAHRRLLQESAPALASLGEDIEDVHTYVEQRLYQDVGELASQAHLGRSRNEQTAVATRLFARGACDRLGEGVVRLVRTLAEQGRAGAEVVMPGFTHTRAAEPITFGHWAAAHAWALVRDRDRLRDTRRRGNVLPLGSGALSGTVLPIDRRLLAEELGFDEVSENALDAVSDRDFAAETAFVCAMLQTHLARLSEDLIRFSGPELGFLYLPDAFTTGSSLMPQKQNPDALELIRGKAARTDADLLRLLVLLKGLPSGYQKDLQEDKEALFDAVDTVEASLGVMHGVVSGLVLDRAAMAAAAGEQTLMAAGLAVALAREGMPFRQAHRLVGQLVAEAQGQGVSLRSVAESRLARDWPQIVRQLDALLDPCVAVRSKTATGSTAPRAVAASLAEAGRRVGLDLRRP